MADNQHHEPDEGASAPASRYAMSLAQLEGGAHVPVSEQTVEIPAQAPGRGPADEELDRLQRDVLRAGG